MAPPRVEKSITLFGSAPWGFRVSGGKEFNQALVISRVTPGSIAWKSGVTAGDVLLAVDGQFASNMTQDECEDKVAKALGSLMLVVEKVSGDGEAPANTDGMSISDRMARHNRSARPFPGSFTTAPSKPDASPAASGAAKPTGFRSVAFNPSKSRANPNLPPPADLAT